LELLVALLLETAREQPVLFVVEDLHWADPSTLKFLGLLLDQAPTAKVLAVFTFRPEFSPPWTRRAHLTQINLNRLTRRQALQMVDRVTGGKPIPEEVLSQVASKSDGVPLFVEELTRMVVESGLLKEVDDHYVLTGPLPPLAIPSTLQDSLTARLDRLASAREVAQLGAVLGREFPYELVQYVSPLNEPTLRRYLEQLVKADFLNQRGMPPKATYIFRHAFVQDAAYQSLLKSRRQQYHQQVARVLEERFPEVAETQPELLAHHYSEAGIAAGAVPYLQRAGERALAAYAWEEALAHFQRGLAARGVSQSGAEPAKDAATAALLFGLGRAQSGTLERRQTEEAVATLGRAFDYYAAAGDVAGALAVAQYPTGITASGRTGVAGFIPRALKLVPPDSLAAGRLLCSYGGELGRVEGDYENAEVAFAQALAIARREGDPVLEVRTLAAASNVDFYHLRFQEGLEAARRAIALAGRLGDQQAAWLAHWNACIILTFTGEVGEAQQHAAAALELAERLRGRFQLGVSFWCNAMLLRQQGGWQGVREFSDRGLAVAPQDVPLLGERVLLEYQVGDFAQGEAYLERLLATMSPAAARPGVDYACPAATLLLVSRITGVLDRLEVAETAARTVVSSPFANPFFATMARAGLGLLAVLRDDAPAAAERYGPLQSQAGTMYWAISIDRLLGLLAQTMGNLDKAAEHFEDALAFCRRAGYRPELAWSLCDYADCLVVGAGFKPAPTTADRTKALSLLDESLAISRELGMRLLMERVLGRRERLTA
jgi:tetratricopeptide (TPR) repeat protein